jgi:uncharacterized protein
MGHDRLAGVLILLPPSEGKAAPETGAPLDLDSLSLPELSKARKRVLTALVKLSSGREKRALDTLGLGPTQHAELERNRTLLTAPAQEARKVYTGVVYEALDLDSLSADALQQAEESILIASGLWGMTRISDRIPAYRCSIGAKLPVLGGLSAYWKKALEPVLTRAVGDTLVMDLRSEAYAKTWRGDRTVTVRVLHERDGRRTVVSHFNKATKGRLVRDLLQAGARPVTTWELVHALRDLKYEVEGEGDRLDVVVREL